MRNYHIKQLVGFIIFKIKKKIPHPFSVKYPARFFQLHLDKSIPAHRAYSSKNNFIFLNLSKKFDEKIDWNFSGNGKLWNYHLNSFEFLLQQEITREQGTELINDFIQNSSVKKISFDSHPTSLRIINWIKFISFHQINDENISYSLFKQSNYLSRHIEYYLRNNHLLENAFALLFASYFFRDEKLYIPAKKILIKELSVQILADGAHFERCPMYHQLMLFRMLDSVNLLKNNKWMDRELLELLLKKSSGMLGWLTEINFEKGIMPLINDSAEDIAPYSTKLFEYANQLQVEKIIIRLRECGFRKIKTPKYELLIDAGYMPSGNAGHIHSGIFHFILFVYGQPLIVDSGISTYENKLGRENERSTAAHNTVAINKKNQSDVYDIFKVGKQAKVFNLKDGNNFFEASHNGYQSSGIIHTRRFETDDNKIIIHDYLNAASNKNAQANFHFHDSTLLSLSNKSLKTSLAEIEFSSAEKIEMTESNISRQFNNTHAAPHAIVFFKKTLTTIIHIH